MTRRGFLSSTGATLGAVAATGLVTDRLAFAQASDTLKIALVGCGGRGSGAANQALSVPGTKLIAMADAFKDRLEGSLNNLKQSKGAQVDVPPDRQFVGLDGFKQAIALADVVILATPPGFRPFHFEEAIRQGKHVFMEKPVATDGPGVRRVLACNNQVFNVKCLQIRVVYDWVSDNHNTLTAIATIRKSIPRSRTTTTTATTTSVRRTRSRLSSGRSSPSTTTTITASPASTTVITTTSTTTTSTERSRTSNRGTHTNTTSSTSQRTVRLIRANSTSTTTTRTSNSSSRSRGTARITLACSSSNSRRTRTTIIVTTRTATRTASQTSS